MVNAMLESINEGFLIFNDSNQVELFKKFVEENMGNGFHPILYCNLLQKIDEKNNNTSQIEFS